MGVVGAYQPLHKTEQYARAEMLDELSNVMRKHGDYPEEFTFADGFVKSPSDILTDNELDVISEGTLIFASIGPYGDGTVVYAIVDI